MKFILAAATLLGAALAQSLGDLPQCGQTCVSGMLSQASQLGCPSSDDAACLCRNPDFGNGVRDCANEACPDASAADQVVQYGVAYCAAVASGSTASSLAATSALTATGGGDPEETGGAAGGLIPISTQTQLTTITTGDSPITSTLGVSTIFSSGTGAAGSAASSVASAASAASESGESALSDASSVAASGASAASSAAGSAASAASSGANSALASASDAVSSAEGAASSAAGAATSAAEGDNAAPMATVAANALAGVAGLAAMMWL